MPVNRKVLLVDDDPLLLRSLARRLKSSYAVFTAEGPREGLAVLSEEEPFAVIVSDMRMPVMNGAEFLRRAREEDPDAVRMVLSGESDLTMTIAAVNEGDIFRFLTKPCSGPDFDAAVSAAMEQHRLVMAERELLENTLSGTVHLLTDLLALASPIAYSRASTIRRVVDELVTHLGHGTSPWEVRLAAMLYYLGCLSIPDEILARAFAGAKLTEEEQALFTAHTEVASRLLGKIPRLDTVARILETHRSAPSAPLPANIGEWSSSELGRRVLDVAARYSEHLAAGATHSEAYGRVREEGGVHRALLEALARVRIHQGDLATVGVVELRPGMVLTEDVRRPDGELLLASGYTVTDAVITRLRHQAEASGVAEPIHVRLPLVSDHTEDAEAEAEAEG